MRRGNIRLRGRAFVREGKGWSARAAGGFRALSRSGGGTCERARGGAVVGADTSQGARGEWRRPRKAEVASGGRRKRYRGTADERARGVSDTRQRVRGSGGLVWAERVRVMWLGWLGRPKGHVGLGWLRRLGRFRPVSRFGFC